MGKGREWGGGSNEGAEKVREALKRKGIEKGMERFEEEEK